MRLGSGDRVRIDTGALPTDAVCLAVAVALHDTVPGSLAAVTGLGVTVSGSGPGYIAGAEGLTSERAAVLVEIYRRGDNRKV